MRRKTMSDDKYKREHSSGERSDVPNSESATNGDRQLGFDCIGTGMGEAMAKCPCGSIMRRHPFLTSAMLAVTGLALLVIPAGALLGIIAFFRAI
jgi:hypothetical protein